MPCLEKGPGPFRLAAIRGRLAGIFIVGAGFASCLSLAQTTFVTQLAQLNQVLGRTNNFVGGLQLQVSVFACNTNSGALVVSDASGAQLLEIDGLDQEFQPGDRIEIESSNCLVRTSDVGLYISAAPLLNNDGTHPPRVCEGDFALAAGRHPLRVDWFNLINFFDLNISCVAARSAGPVAGSESGEAEIQLHAVQAECYEGNWFKLPNFQLLQPVKLGQVTNFSLDFRTRDDYVGVRFYGYFEAPRSGIYHFSLRSDDGSLLWIGNPAVPVRKVGAGPAPPAPLAAIGEPMTRVDERHLATVEGRVNFVSRFGKGLRLEMRSGPESLTVSIGDAGNLQSEALLHAFVRISGVAEGVLIGDRRVALGRLAASSLRELTIIEPPPGKGERPPVLTTLLQVHSLATNEAAQGLPVRIRGVVTAVGPYSQHWLVIQDDTHGGFIRASQLSNSVQRVGEFWEITGRTRSGDFAPIVMAEQAKFLGKGWFPEPSHPTWNQLANGSMDVQWVEVQGLVTSFRGSNSLSLLLPEGEEEVKLDGWGEAELTRFVKSVVRIRGAFFAIWNSTNHEVRVGAVEIRNASVAVDEALPADPFDAPEKTPRGLYLFDATTEPFRRVKVSGQVTYADAWRVFIQRGAGLEVFPIESVQLDAGDLVDTVGYPDISGPSAVLRGAHLRKTGSGVLPPPPLVADSDLAQDRLASKRICVEGTLAGQYREEGVLVLQIQTPAHFFLARVSNPGPLDALRQGSRLSLTGVLVSDAHNSTSENRVPRLELLVHAPADVVVVAKPSWWTLRRLLTAVGLLLVSLTIAVVWITQLRRQVAQRTLQLQREIRERERAERQQALEAERSRIARDLHDDLGATLTEISVLASTGQRARSEDNANSSSFKAIEDRARGLVVALDAIVWAVDPEDNTLQSLADYLGGYARDFLANSAIACRFKIPVKLPDAALDGEDRHELLMVVKEALSNIVRHADATAVEFQLDITEGVLAINIKDNGKGFDPGAEPGGHGLKNRLARLAKIGGHSRIESRAGVGTTVSLRLPLPKTAAGDGETANTTYG